MRPQGLARLLSLACSLFVLNQPVTTAAAASLKAKSLRCEYAENPLGLDVQRPRLSWTVESSQRAQRQTAFQILVASSSAQLKANAGDLWDSGQVDSAQSIHVEYGGPPLRSRQRCWWKVRVWDTGGRPSAWSQAAFWEMGLLRPADWQASWIGFEQPWPGQETWSNARWIWAAPAPPFPADGTNPPPNAPPGAQAFFRSSFKIPAGSPIDSALLRVTADDYCEVYLNGELAWRNCGKPYSCKILQEIRVKHLLVPGNNLVAVLATNREDHAGLLGQLTVRFDRGPDLALVTDQSWLANTKARPGWNQKGFADANWPKAVEMARAGQAPWEAANYPPMQPAPFLRKTIELSQSVQSARLYATALGVYEFHLNGQRVSDDLFNPGWTDYARRVQYHTYDVTPLLRRGVNALGIVLGDGWYSGFVGLGGRCRYGTLPLALAQLEVTFADGSRQTIGTDASWKASTGPLLQSDMLMGEVYDARQELPGWDRPGFDDSRWQPVKVKLMNVNLVAAPDPPVRKTQEVKPRSLTQPKPGAFVFDLGQNVVGGIRLRVRAQTGDTLVLRFAEMLNPDGTLYTENLREARCVDRYVCRGGGEEVYVSRFTFHGFRYAELTGYRGQPTVDTLTGLVYHSDTPPAGMFACSNPLINQLLSNIVWGQRGNFLSIPTDCPQRDERLGWTGDAQVFIRTATYNMDVAAFFTKWCQDVEDAQQPDGAFPDVVPFVAARTGTAAWGDAGVICPWTIHQVYGDRRILERHYEAGVRWIDYLLRNSTNYLRPATRYGDWLSINADTPLDLLATAYFAHSTRLMSQMASTLGRGSDAAKYETLFQQIRAAFQKAYVTDRGRVHGDTQTGYVLALAFDLLPEELRPAAVERLVADIRAKGNHLSTGFVGVGHLLPTLTRAGHLDTAYQLLLQDTFPSWLYSVKNGATTIWERWDGWTRERGFQTPWMNSFNHYSLGSVGAWLFETVGGIGLDPAQPGFKRIVIRPQPGGGLTWAKAEFDSIHGPIASDWRLEKGVLRLNVTIPANTTATVYLPAKSADLAREGGRPAAKAEGVQFVRVESGNAVFAVGSGNYHFSVPVK